HEPRPGVPTAFVRTAYLEALAGVAVIVAAAVLTQSTVARNVLNAQTSARSTSRRQPLTYR
ncbi:MAG: hypothetical protein AB7T37_00870, partial [Dehalococcoidia bacterium]